MKIFGNTKSHKAKEKQGKRKKKSKSKLFPLFATLFVLGAMAFTGAAILNHFIKPPEIPLTIPPAQEAPEEPSLPLEINTPVPALMEQESGKQNAAHIPGRKDNFYTFILAGVDLDDYHTDTLMVAAFDAANQKLNVISIPRDTMVNVKRSVKKINSAYGMGNSRETDGGVAQLRAEVATILGFTPDFYAVVNMEGFIAIIDAIDGVEYDVPQNMKKAGTPGAKPDTSINLQKGLQKLDGAKALQLVRFRDYGEGDLKRMEVQQDFLKTTAKQLISVQNVLKLPEIMEIAERHLNTNLEVGNMLWLGRELLKLDGDDITFHTYPVFAGWYNKGSYTFVKEKEALELINETVNPYERPITASDLNILILQN